jgi:hypothetical protein
MCTEKTHVLPDELADLKATLTEVTRPNTIPGVVASAAALTLDGAATLLRSIAWTDEDGKNWNGQLDSEKIHGVFDLLITCIRLIAGDITPHNWEEK